MCMAKRWTGRQTEIATLQLMNAPITINILNTVSINNNNKKLPR